jgi:ferredoxin
VNRLRVNWAACDAHGLCALWAPELITRDEWGYPVLRDGPVPDELLAQARAAARSCPALALRVRPTPNG